MMLTLTIIMASACKGNEDGTEPIYCRVVNVPLREWSASDTLFFPVQVTYPTTLRTPIVQGLTYQVRYNIRMSANYKFTRVPMQFIVQQTDTTGGHEHIVRNVLRQNIAPAVRDTLGHPLGPSWGSLIDYENVIDGLTLRFDSLGTYRMMLIPETKGLSGFDGISAVGISLTRHL